MIRKLKHENESKEKTESTQSLFKWDDLTSK
jgi:hypothetical protein